jgi:hypothetical protein
MQMPLVRLNVMIGVAKLERITKTDPALRPLLLCARSLLHRLDQVQQEIVHAVVSGPGMAA